MNQDFRIKGFHIDLRIQVMPMPALRRLVEELAQFGLNTLVVEWEASYPYEKHAIISNEYAYTREEVESFIASCNQIGIDVIPLQQCFGHLEYILRHERYAHLRESDKDICQLCPLKEKEAFPVFRELLSDMATTHPSPYIHIGGDETYLLGHCRHCRSKAQEAGVSRLYVDYLKKIAQWVIKLGKRPVLWADMLLKHPEAAGEMPAACIFVDWNYGWRPGYFGDISRIAGGGFELWGAAAARANPDNHSLTQWAKHFDNLKHFIPYAREQGYQGMVLTSWSTSGVYGFEWEQAGEVVEMHPMRRVYPLAGFRILLAAYSEALKQTEPIAPREFVQRYAMQRFGLSARGGTQLWQALTVDASPIQPGVAIEPVLQQARKAKRIFASLAPRQHIGEFEHLRLMADLREFHVRFKKLEREIQSPGFTAAQVPAKVRALERLIEEAETLDHRFIRANRGLLYEKALAEEIEARSKKLHRLHDRLTRSGRAARKVSVALLGLQRRWSWWNGAKRHLSKPARVPLQSPSSQ